MVAKPLSNRNKRSAPIPDDVVLDTASGSTDDRADDENESDESDDQNDDDDLDEVDDLEEDQDDDADLDDEHATIPAHLSGDGAGDGPDDETHGEPTAQNDAAVRLLEDAIEPAARAMGYEVVLLEWLGGRGGRIARIYLDHPNGISLGDCSRMSRIFSNALDAAEVDPELPALAALLAQPYTLEVSSPGVDRPLVRLSHFARQVGGRAVLRTRGAVIPGSDQKTFHGHIVGSEVDPTAPEDDRRGVVLLRALDSDIIHSIALVDLRRANLVFEMPGMASPKPGGAAKGAKSPRSGNRSSTTKSGTAGAKSTGVKTPHGPQGPKTA